MRTCPNHWFHYCKLFVRRKQVNLLTIQNKMIFFNWSNFLNVIFQFRAISNLGENNNYMKCTCVSLEKFWMEFLNSNTFYWIQIRFLFYLIAMQILNVDPSSVSHTVCYGNLFGMHVNLKCRTTNSLLFGNIVYGNYAVQRKIDELISHTFTFAISTQIIYSPIAVWHPSYKQWCKCNISLHNCKKYLKWKKIYI